MLRLILVLLALFMSYSFYAQQSLNFNMLLTYECKFVNQDSTLRTETRYKLTNSKDNSYFIDIKNLDSLNYHLTLKYFDHILTEFKVDKENFKTVNRLNIECDLIFNYKHNFKNVAKDYSIVNKEDTLINNIKYKQYQSKYLRGKKSRLKKKAGQITYIIENNTEYHLPIISHPTLNLVWKLKKNVPNGIFKEFIFKDYLGKIINHYTLLKIEKINLIVNTEKPCHPKNYNNSY